MSLVIKPIQNSSDYVLDNLSATTRSANTVAFSLKPLSQSYTGPIVRLRHSATGATKDFYANTSGNLGDNYGGSGITPETWIGTNNLATVDTWYDQSGNSRNATQTTVANQPILLKRSNGYVVAFNASSLHFMSYTSSIWNNTNYTAIIKEQRSSSKIDNYFHGTTTESTNANLHIGYRTNTQFTHSQFANDYNYNVNGFAIYDTTNTYSPISSYTTGTPILSIDSPYTTPEGSFGFDGITGKYISINVTPLTTGFQWWTNGGCTMECWVKYTSFTNASRPTTYIVPTLFGNMNPTTGDAAWGFGATTSGTLTFYYWTGTARNISTTAVLPLNKWTHIAMSCDGTNIRLFINGILSAGPTAVILTPSLSVSFTVGQHYNLSPSVYISNLRIVQGTALYTSNFTPSVTSPLTTASSGTTLLLLRVPTSINRWLVSHHTTDVPGKRMYLNGTQVASLANNVSLSSPGQATLGRYGPTPSTRYFTGDLYHFMGFNISLPVSDPTAITTLDNYLNYATRLPRLKLTPNTTLIQRGISIPTGNVFAGIPPSVLNTCIGAFSARRIIQSYNGPIFRLRRDSDNNEVDVWIDYEGNVERVVDLSLDDGLSFGGTITYDGAYRIHTFTTNGTFATSNIRVCDLLVVGGGGSGGYTGATFTPGGGGGGGEVYFKKNTQLSIDSYTVSIGTGGTGGTQNVSGGNSSFGLIIAKGGGTRGTNGGSGGGGARNQTGGQSIKALGKGNRGGTSGNLINVNAGGSGGGGATQAGKNPIGNNGGTGGEGLICDISGTVVVYGSGGGGGRRNGTNGQGGTNAGNGGAPGGNGVENTGGGGGGAEGVGVASSSGSGGSGIVLVRTLRHQGIQGRSALTQWLGSSTATMTKWYDQSGYANHVTTIRGNPRVSSYPNDTYIYGNINDGLRFPGAILPSNYTFFYSAQYQPNTSNAPIFDSFTNDWFSSYDGTIQKRYGWVIDHSSNVFNSNLTVSMDQPNLYRVNGGITTVNSFMRKYPPAALTDFTTTISNATYGNGTYIVSSSDTENSIVERKSWTLFANNYNTSTSGYHSSSVFTSYIYSGTGITDIEGINTSGLWIQIQVPQQIVLKGYKIVLRPQYITNKDRLPKQFWVVGSNITQSSWSNIDQKNYTVTDWNSVVYNVENTQEGIFYTSNNTKAFSYFRLVIQSITPVYIHTITNFWNWDLYADHTTRSGTLSINYGNTLKYSDWIVKDVVVFNNTLSSTNISMVESALMLRRLGILDQVAPSTKATAVAGYSFRLLTVSYMGPCVRIRRGTDNAEKDFYASTTGDLGDLYLGRGQTLKEWLNGATAYVRTWYDQTGRAKHVEQGSTASQPTIVFSNTQGNGIYFTNTFLSGANVFDTTTVSNMHMVMASREIARVVVLVFSLNGNNGNTPGRFAAHIPYTNDIVYFDPGSSTTDRAQSPVNILSVGQKSVFSGYKSSSEGKNGFRINKGTRYLSSGITTADVSGGIRMGQLGGISANHNIYAFIVFNTKLNTTDELLIENNIAPFK